LLARGETVDRSHPVDDEEDDDLRPYRAQHRPPHQEFFADGEKPPMRYDTADNAEIVPISKEPLEPEHWFALASHEESGLLHSNSSELVCYALLSVIGNFSLPVLFNLFLQPICHADISSLVLRRLVKVRGRFRPPIGVVEHIVYFSVARLPVSLARLITLYGLFGIFSSLANDSAMQTGDPELERQLLPVFIVTTILGLALTGFFAIRASAFVEQLILDYRFGPFEAIRANWRITRGRTLMLTKMMLRLWAKQLLRFVFGVVIGYFFVEYYVTLVRTAAYLDITGALYDDDEIHQEMHGAKQTS
jgi:hypothetical protein